LAAFLLKGLWVWQRGERFIRQLAEAPVGQLFINNKALINNIIRAFCGQFYRNEGSILPE